MYRVFQAPGWHGEPNDPCIMETEDRQAAAMRAGERADIGMPGHCNPYDAYAQDEDGNDLDLIESFRCEACEELIEWGEYGPTGTMGGKVLECAESVEKHLVTWLCTDCASNLD